MMDNKPEKGRISPDHNLSKQQLVELAKELKEKGKTREAIADILRLPESSVRTMLKEHIDWTENCLTGGIHSGRDEAIWKIPLGYAVIIFRRQYLKDLIINRIYSDAMAMVLHGGEKFTQEWADLVKEIAIRKYDPILQQKVGELSKYYKTPGWELEQQEAARRVAENKLNPGYEPLHGHDTLNLLCRIIGTSAEWEARRELEADGGTP